MQDFGEWGLFHLSLRLNRTYVFGKHAPCHANPYTPKTDNHGNAPSAIGSGQRMLTTDLKGTNIYIVLIPRIPYSVKSDDTYGDLCHLYYCR